MHVHKMVSHYANVSSERLFHPLLIPIKQSTIDDSTALMVSVDVVVLVVWQKTVFETDTQRAEVSGQ